MKLKCLLAYNDITIHLGFLLEENFIFVNEDECTNIYHIAIKNENN